MKTYKIIKKADIQPVKDRDIRPVRQSDTQKVTQWVSEARNTLRSRENKQAAAFFKMS